VRTATVEEVKQALKNTNDTINQSCNDFQRKLTTAVDTAETQMKVTAEKYSQEVDKINKALDNKLRELEDKQRQFFMFSGVKHFFFWLSQIVSFGTLALLIHFLFFKK
jgi:replicative DNA helicase